VIVLVLGGTRSGKSELAERLARDLAAPHGAVTYVATASARDDDDFRGRITRHRDRRPREWTTVEVDDNLPEVVATLAGVVLIDSLGAWVAACDFAADTDALVASLQARAAPTVVVSEEVGLGVHPPTALGVRFADALGDANRALAGIAQHTVFVAAGRTIELHDADAVVGTIARRVSRDDSETRRA